ncbi:hypothetical protein CVD28_09200 [Bacillus sp. M6-12]|uniref:TIGR03826 family flagellar region protein n=1 Tax=Bacillus sp. M6-12 TaxID=2054166 RepID=UPI000C77F5C9|nr:TIGR03826 family flagellar region protein [Bacillus sp. M6-12]PLS17862.1 hypothetical protein CVD28_09200 [Bacillus sp. M6-12]
MNDLNNCPNCDALFVRTKFRDVCDACYKQEEKEYEKVYQYIRKRENRTATLVQVVENTGVDEDLVVKFIKTGKLRTSQFPNLGIKCDKCGTTIKEGRLCVNCQNALKSQLGQFEKEEARRKEIEERGKKGAYYTHLDD